MSSPTAGATEARAGSAPRLQVLNPAFAATDAPPIVAARTWVAGRAFPPERPLIDVSQAAPAAPPPEPLRQVIAEASLTLPEAHLYGPVLGLAPLRDEIARRWSADYGGRIGAEQVAVTSGCNQAFVAAMATLAGPGDAVLLPSPWYFNHKMWLDMSGVRAVPLPCDATLLPDPDAARALVGPETRAIVLVSPNNPAGVEYPAGLVAAFRDLARETGLVLVIDETYRDFDAREGPPHRLFAGDWDDSLIHLYSFSKAYRLTGHRVGALIASAARLAEVEKFLDTVAICPAQLGQHAALHGLRHLGDWVAGERAEILARRRAMQEVLTGLDGWRLRGIGAYFAYVEHGSAEDATDVARRLVDEAHVLALPGTIFAPPEDPLGTRCLRIAFANLDVAGIAELGRRLSGAG